MKHKVGDTVTIKPISWYDTNKTASGDVLFEDAAFLKEMSNYCGLKAKIVSCFLYSYRIDIDDEYCLWTDDMFEESEPKVISEEIIRAAALKHAGFKEGVDPNDEDERYYNSTRCNLYDGFIAGAKFIQNQK